MLALARLVPTPPRSAPPLRALSITRSAVAAWVPPLPPVWLSLVLALARTRALVLVLPPRDLLRVRLDLPPDRRDLIRDLLAPRMTMMTSLVVTKWWWFSRTPTLSTRVTATRMRPVATPTPLITARRVVAKARASTAVAAAPLTSARVALRRLPLLAAPLLLPPVDLLLLPLVDLPLPQPVGPLLRPLAALLPRLQVDPLLPPPAALLLLPLVDPLLPPPAALLLLPLVDLLLILPVALLLLPLLLLTKRSRYEAPFSLSNLSSGGVTFCLL